jgi:XTP/dITP diphosphohydrolase
VAGTPAEEPVGARLLDLVAVMDRLRQQCPWDQQQTHLSLVQYLVEETYETIEALESGDRDHMCEELGDLLLQVVFHARIAAEHTEAPFDIDDVATSIVEKLVRRHPHVFDAASVPGAGAHDTTNAAGVQGAWDVIKAAEKQRTSTMDGIAAGMPALTLAVKVAARSPKARGVEPPSGAPLPESSESLGEALFSLAVAAQAAGLDPEQALRNRVRREMAEVRAMEQRALRATPREPG